METLVIEIFSVWINGKLRKKSSQNELSSIRIFAVQKYLLELYFRVSKSDNFIGFEEPVPDNPLDRSVDFSEQIFSTRYISPSQRFETGKSPPYVSNKCRSVILVSLLVQQHR